MEIFVVVELGFVLCMVIEKWCTLCRFWDWSFWFHLKYLWLLILRNTWNMKSSMHCIWIVFLSYQSWTFKIPLLNGSKNKLKKKEKKTCITKKERTIPCILQSSNTNAHLHKHRSFKYERFRLDLLRRSPSVYFYRLPPIEKRRFFLTIF